MSQRFTEPAHEQHEDATGDTPLEWDGEGAPLNVLWGRLAVLALLLVLAFLGGRLTAPEGVSSERLSDVQAQLADARQQVDGLEGTLDEAEAAAEEARAEAEAAEEAAAESPATPEDAAEEPVPGDTYVVEAGDTLQSIAEQFYENPALGDVIAEANDITDPAQLSPGTELIIPDRPEL